MGQAVTEVVWEEWGILGNNRSLVFDVVMGEGGRRGREGRKHLRLL